ncbi:hypothetical protein DYB37_004053 [Aphanomyces astaci]|uniref:EB1 C-terminal domain-containing protein n=1 Tax=Aphanomyces astaci TaxID=112090 RepID=A0A397E011_APHAT|nr:hypothetical protein DYB25_008965 [Aphanomyces astaci]RHY14133.1 hypothetical protein DYB36_002855 [Aphanomyces astaci]RHY58300.1 hypothetical protein DYB34_011036 [Aphanomyces astaci]RHY70268.1 hypothetical protein DYB38_003735 [Aphanomyces astaci]RHY92729.1 hypothetical protein DYB35_006498 [Aphanomyces astaci]
MMDGAYFVGRKDILDWVNATCALSLTKVEQTCTGAVACQILDAIYPGKVQMSKVDWSANKDYEYIQNYKILQKTFTTLKIDRHIEVDKLIRGKYQDNLEFMQWYKRFYELNAGGAGDYDPIAQREKGKGGAAYSAKYKFAGATAGAPAPAKKRPVASTSKASAKPPGAPVSVEKEKAGGFRDSAASSKELEESIRENEELNEANGILRGQIEGLEKERDFYFGKLRDIESMLQELDESQHTDVIKKIFEVLYAAEGDFSVPDDDAGGEDELM